MADVPGAKSGGSHREWRKHGADEPSPTPLPEESAYRKGLAELAKSKESMSASEKAGLEEVEAIVRQGMELRRDGYDEIDRTLKAYYGGLPQPGLADDTKAKLDAFQQKAIAEVKELFPKLSFDEPGPQASSAAADYVYQATPVVLDELGLTGAARYALEKVQNGMMIPNSSRIEIRDEEAERKAVWSTVEQLKALMHEDRHIYELPAFKFLVDGSSSMAVRFRELVDKEFEAARWLKRETTDAGDTPIREGKLQLAGVKFQEENVRDARAKLDSVLAQLNPVKATSDALVEVLRDVTGGRTNEVVLAEWAAQQDGPLARANEALAMFNRGAQALSRLSGVNYAPIAPIDRTRDAKAIGRALRKASAEADSITAGFERVEADSRELWRAIVEGTKNAQVQEIQRQLREQEQKAREAAYAKDADAP